MIETKNFKFPKPEEDDFYNIKDYNKAMDILDETLGEVEEKKLDKNGNASEVTTEFEQEILRENLKSGEKLSVSFGKIKKWFSELSKVAFSGRALDIAEDAAHRFVSDTDKKNWNGKVSADGGDISNTKIETLDAVKMEFPVPEEGETTKVFLGKVRKFIQDFQDFKSGIITVGKLANNGSTTGEGYALDARYGKTLFDFYSQLNSNLMTQVLAKDTNLDTIKTDGYYTFEHSSGQFEGWNILRVRNYNNDHEATEQIVTRRYSGKIYKRILDSGLWKSWDSTALNSDLAAGHISEPSSINMDSGFFPENKLYYHKFSAANPQNIKGFPHNAYGYGALITGINVDKWGSFQIYIPHTGNNDLIQPVYFRTFQDGDVSNAPSWRYIAPQTVLANT